MNIFLSLMKSLSEHHPIDINDIRQEERTRLLVWFDGNSNGREEEKVRVQQALDFLYWCFSQSSPLDYLPLTLRNEKMNQASKLFELPVEKISKMYVHHEKLFESNSNKRANIIAFEGIDGSGKTIQLRMLVNSLKTEGHKVIEKSFPVYESFFGQEIGKLLSGETSLNATTVDPRSMALWYGVDRWREFQSLVNENYDYLLLNRFTLSSAVYQSVRITNETESLELMDWIFELEHKQLNLPVPDLYILFDISPQISKENILQKGHREYIGVKADVYEESTDVLFKARKRYIQASSKLDNVVLLSTLDDAGRMKSQEDIHIEVMAILTKKNLF